jgi:hypothetical protein
MTRQDLDDSFTPASTDRHTRRADAFTLQFAEEAFDDAVLQRME